MKKLISFLVVSAMMLALLVPCFALAAGSDEIVDGKFVETKKITVEIFDRGLDGGKTAPENNVFTDFIKEGLLRDHNIEVTFQPVGRWTETEDIANLLAAGSAPDICLTYSYPTIQTYANMGGILNLTPYLEENKELLTGLWDFLGDYNIYYDQDPNTGDLWAIEGKLAELTRTNTFVRKDWLDKLGLAEPTTLQEFEAMLVAFRDNAETLLGADAAKMIPYATSFDVGWRNLYLIHSFIPDGLTDQERYIKGYDDRFFMYTGAKEAIRTLNKWYNDNLIWKDFPLYGAGDTTEDSLIKSGYVGAFHHNFDYPYRNGADSLQTVMQTMVGEEASFIVVDPFQNDAGKNTKYLPANIDRKIFFPATNKEPVASLMYLNWITTFENRKALQLGFEGINYEVLENGAFEGLVPEGDNAHYIKNSPNNIDYTMTINGYDLGDTEITAKTNALAYPGIPADIIERAYALTNNGAIYAENVQAGEIKAEEGMAEVLKEKRDVVLNQAVVAAASEFDAIFDSGLEDYLLSGGQAIIDERAAAWDSIH